MQNYKLLPILNEILKTQNLTEAANRLHVTQPALSKSFQQIREAFNDPIMIREGRRYILTERGEQLAKELPALLRSIDTLYKSEDFSPKQCTTEFKLAYTTYLAPCLMPIVHPTIEQEAPNIYCEYRLLQSQSLRELAKNELDLVCVMTDSIPENLYGHKLGEDKYVVIMAKNHPLKDKEWTLELYASQKHVQVHNLTDTKGLISNKIQQLGYHRKIAAKVPTFNSAVETVASTQAIVTMPQHLAAIYQKDYPITLKTLPLECPTQKYYLLWHGKKHHSPEHKWLRSMIAPLLTEYLTTYIKKGDVIMKGANY